MKKYLSVGLILLLCFTLSIPSFAIGNTYTFTSSWYQVLFDNALIYTNFTERSSTSDVGAASINGILYNSDSSYNTAAVWLSSNHNLPSGTTDIIIPLNLTLLSSYEFLDLEFLLAFEGDFTINSVSFSIANKDVNVPFTTTDIDLVEFGKLTYPTASATQATFNPIITGSGLRLNIEYNKLISTGVQVVDSVKINISNSYTPFAIGAPCNNNTVTLPDSFYDAIYTIKYFTRFINANIDTLNAYIVSIQSQLDEIIGKVGSSTEEQNNYYNTIVNQSPEQAALVAQLQSDLAAAKEELAEIQEVITSVPAPSSENIFNTNTSTTSEDYISDALTDNTVLDLFTYFFDNSFIIMALGVSITIATVSYILYGKKG